LIIWSDAARHDFDSIWQWTEENRGPAAAARIGNRIIDNVSSLVEFPRLGRAGAMTNTRELVISRTPYIAVYVIADGRVEIVRVLHGRQKWPPRGRRRR
jgi:plasmid stabilization system protein ParE